MPAISYTLTLNDNPLDATVISRLRKVECEEHADMADLLRLTFTLAPGENNSGWAVLDDNIFTRLARLKFTINIGSNNTQPVMEGYVVEVAAEYGNDPANNTLSVVAFDPSILMNLQEKARAWSGMADSAIASTIFEENGFSTAVTDTQPTRAENVQTVIQRGSDMQFLRGLARRNGYECYVDLDTGGQPVGHFHPPTYDATPQGTLSIGMGRDSTIETLRIRYDLLRPAAATIGNLDLYAADEQSATITSVAAPALGRASTLSTDRPRKLLVNPLGLTEAGELQTYAQAVTDRAALAIRAEGELNAQAYQGILRAKRPVLVRGVGTLFSGRYYVERVLHTFEAGSYKQSFTLRRNAVGVAGQEDFTAASS